MIEQKPVTLIYVVGYNYSGSTLLAFILNAHPQIASTGEITGPANFTGQSLCSCGETLNACPVYRDIERRIGHRNFQLDRLNWGNRMLHVPPKLRERVLYGSLRNTLAETYRDWARERLPGVKTAAREKRAVYTSFARAVAGHFGVDIVADTSKNPMVIPFLMHSPEIRVRVLHLVRHPAACVLSALNRSPHGVAAAAGYWTRNFKTAQRIMSRLPHNDYMRLRYEDLCLDPNTSCRALCRWIGVAFNPAMLKFRGADHHIYGNPMRLSSVGEIKMDTRWHTALSDEECKAVAVATNPYADSCGYRFNEKGAEAYGHPNGHNMGRAGKV